MDGQNDRYNYRHIIDVFLKAENVVNYQKGYMEFQYTH